MRRLLFLSAVALCLSAAGAFGAELDGKSPTGEPQPAPKPMPADTGCGNHGTAVQFVATPSDAARQAKKEEKLVLVLHVSGIFEDPSLT